MESKKGDQKYYIIMSLILGIIVLGLSMYYIFNEFFTDEDINWETCRQSIVLRSGNLNSGLKYVQESFPFKCKTELVEIDISSFRTPFNNESFNLINKQVAEVMAECWSLYGEGKSPLYGSDWVIPDTNCFVCARIAFKEDSFYSGKPYFYGDTKILEYLMNNKNAEGQYYFNYLYPDYANLDSFSKNQRAQYLGLLPGALPLSSNDELFVVLTYYSESATASLVNKLPGADITSANSLSMIRLTSSGSFDNLGCDVIETIPA